MARAFRVHFAIVANEKLNIVVHLNGTYGLMILILIFEMRIHNDELFSLKTQTFDLNSIFE